MAGKPISFITIVEGKRLAVEITQQAPSLYKISIDGIEQMVDSIELSPGSFSLLVNNRPFAAEVNGNGEKFTVTVEGKRLELQITDTLSAAATPALGDGAAGPCEIRAMMPGRIVAVLAEAGDEIKKGDGILVVEAMKMENEVTAPGGGRVVEVRVKQGEAVETGQLLAVLS